MDEEQKEKAAAEWRAKIIKKSLPGIIFGAVLALVVGVIIAVGASSSQQNQQAPTTPVADNSVQPATSSATENAQQQNNDTNTSTVALEQEIQQEQAAIQTLKNQQQNTTQQPQPAPVQQTTPPPAPVQQSAPISYSNYSKVLFSTFANDPSAYLGSQIEVKGTVGDFLPEGGSGGSHNYIGVADPNAQTSKAVMFEIDNSSDYLAAVNALQNDDLIAVYGAGMGTASFTIDGQNQIVSVVNVSRLDLVGGCDVMGCLVSTDTIIFSDN